jgi:hypothetical protein
MVEEEAVSASASDLWASDLWDGHQLLVGEQKDDSGLARWAARGLARGDKLLVPADERHPDASSLAATLTRNGVDAARAAGDGRIEVVAESRFYDVEGYERLVEQSLRDGHGGVRSYGGPHVAAEVLDAAALAEFERLLERLWITRGATAVCCFPAAPLGSLDEAIRRHRTGWHHQMLHVRHRGHGLLAVHGEIDASNDELFAAVLAAAADQVGTGTGARGAAGAGDAEEEGPLLVLDCAGLDFSSVSGLRAAVTGTEAFRAGGGRVALTGLRPFTARILHMTGFARVFDLEERVCGTVDE